MLISDWSSALCSADLRPEDRAAAAQEGAVEHVRVEVLRLHRPCHQAGRALFDADHGPAEIPGGVDRDRPDDGVQAGAVAATGEDADPSGHASPSLEIGRAHV